MNFVRDVTEALAMLYKNFQKITFISLFVSEFLSTYF